MLNALGPAGLIDGEEPGKVPGFMWRIVGVLRRNLAFMGFHAWQ